MGLVEELLVIVSWPVAAPAMRGSNPRLTVTACLGLKVIGKPASTILKPLPATWAELMVTGTFPFDVSVTVCSAAAILTVTLPKDTLPVLSARLSTAGLSSTAKFSVALPAFAVKITDSEELTAETVAVNVALVEPAATVTVAGTAIALLLLVTLTVVPPLGAAAPSSTVQLSVPEPVIAALLQVIPSSAAELLGLAASTPVPLRVMTVVGVPDELLVIVSCPAAAPVLPGLNCASTP